jgi:hypothetical protein
VAEKIKSAFLTRLKANMETSNRPLVKKFFSDWYGKVTGMEYVPTTIAVTTVTDASLLDDSSISSPSMLSQSSTALPCALSCTSMDLDSDPLNVMMSPIQECQSRVTGSLETVVKANQQMDDVDAFLDTTDDQ